MSETAILGYSVVSQSRPCPLCESLSSDPLFDFIRRCKACGLGFASSLDRFHGDNESPEYFLNEYLPLHMANRNNSLAERRAHLSLIRRYSTLPAHPRLLDIGCALGFMLEEAQAAGWVPTGIDTSPFAAQYAARQTHCPVLTGTLLEQKFEAGSFDVVTLMDVIEHVIEPRCLMDEVHRILRPGGVVFLITPNLNSLFVRFYGQDAYGIGPEEHVNYFQSSTITRLLRQAGFSKIKTGTKDLYAANLARLLGRGSQANIKTAFGRGERLGKLRDLANRVLMRIPIGDKLLALAQR